MKYLNFGKLLKQFNSFFFVQNYYKRIIFLQFFIKMFNGIDRWSYGAIKGKEIHNLGKVEKSTKYYESLPKNKKVLLFLQKKNPISEYQFGNIVPIWLLLEVSGL